MWLANLSRGVQQGISGSCTNCGVQLAAAEASRTKVDFVYENKTGFLYFNENGKKSGFGDGGLFAQLQGKPELFADDFRIV